MGLGTMCAGLCAYDGEGQSGKGVSGRARALGLILTGPIGVDG